MTHHIVVLSMVALLCCLVHRVEAADPSDERAEALAKRLASSDATEVDKAVEEVQTAIESDPERSVGYLRRLWIKPLQESHRFDLIESVSIRGILAVAHRTGDVEFLQETRVRVSLASGKPNEALAQAKALFNVAGMRNTEKTLLLVAECLNAAHPRDTQVLRQLVREQRARATTRPVSDTPTAGGLLKNLSADSAPFQAAVQQITSDDDRSLLAKGNLLLLCGQAKEAKAAFEQILKLVESPGLGQHENVARAIRAEDGDIGRANGYLLAIPDNQR